MRPVCVIYIGVSAGARAPFAHFKIKSFVVQRKHHVRQEDLFAKKEERANLEGHRKPHDVKIERYYPKIDDAWHKLDQVLVNVIVEWYSHDVVRVEQDLDHRAVIDQLIRIEDGCQDVSSLLWSDPQLLLFVLCAAYRPFEGQEFLR